MMQSLSFTLTSFLDLFSHSNTSMYGYVASLLLLALTFLLVFGAIMIRELRLMEKTAHYERDVAERYSSLVEMRKAAR